MSKKNWFIIAFLCVIVAKAQFQITGIVQNETNQPISNALITIGNHHQIETNDLGQFTFQMIPEGNHQITIQGIGYQTLHQTIEVSRNQHFIFTLQDDFIELETSRIIHKHGNQIENSTTISSSELQENYQGSVAKSLEKTAGIQSMGIGSSSSKPVIRGLGFNRISVSENGIKQEGQQWGADHGLEINPWSIEKIKIIKGAATLEFGGDAMGGVISIDNSQKPMINSFAGDLNLFTASNNQALGSHLNVQQRFSNFYYKLSTAYTDFADYRIPTKSIVYLNRNIPIHNEILKNTAGREFSINSQLGYVEHSFENVFNISNYYHKSGFFPGSHGVPDINRLQDDGNRRNIEFPFQNVNHFKVSNETTLKFRPNTLSFLLAYQNNHRQEWSEFHTHYGNFQLPSDVNPDLELDFNLSTYDAQIKYEHKLSSRHRIKIGLQSQFQNNLIAGYNFLLPKFKKSNGAGFILSNWEINNQWSLNLGARVDFTNLKIDSYFDQSLFNFLISNGHSQQNAEEVAQKSPKLNKKYTNINGAFGILHKTNSSWDIQFNLGTNFRVPTAIELASNGIHHGSFRHEKGNPNLNPEKGFSSDLKITYHPSQWNLEINPYLYYFQNYIFLEPSSVFSPLPHAGQIYQFTQSRALISGIDLTLQADLSQKIHGNLSLEYLYNQQISKDKSLNGYPLPFSPPLSVFGELNYKFIQHKKTIDLLQFQVNAKVVSAQNRVAKNEAKTDGHSVFGLGIKSTFKWQKLQINAHLSVDNLLDTKYYNHMSFYRALEIPEMGRNIKIIVSISF